MMDFEKKYPADPNEYKLYEEVGEGVSATVFRALCIPANEIVAIKVLDLERCNSDLDGIRREVQTMNLIDHPNVLRAYCSFIVGYSLWVVMPYMTGGSCLHIMKTAYPEGFEENVIATLLKETLKALVYLHSEGHIHRDVKAGNILIDTNGSVKLADFGVSACMFDTGDRQRSRNTFVGTPCWMAPEVMQQLHGYDFKADIWSFGITALELAHGHAPFSKYPPMKVLLMTLQNAPPGLDYERDKRFSKLFKEMVTACLVKDPRKRPTSEKLIKHPFFRNARSSDYVYRSVLEGLHPLGERYKTMKAKEADLLIQNKLQNDEKEQRSQKEYIKGISAWNFNLGDLKSQAANMQDDCEMQNVEYNRSTINQTVRENDEDSISNDSLPLAKDILEDNNNDVHEADNSPKPLQELNECFEAITEDAPESRTEINILTKSYSCSKDLDTEKFEVDNVALSDALWRKKLMADRKAVAEDSKEVIYQKLHLEKNCSGPLINRIKREINVSTAQDDASEAVVKLKGRFKVTSAELSPKGPSSSKASVISSLQTILQQNTNQRDEITKLIKYLEQPNVRQFDTGDSTVNETYPGSLTAREIELQNLAITHEQSIRSLTEDLQRLKLKNAELEELLNVKRQREL